MARNSERASHPTVVEYFSPSPLGEMPAGLLRYHALRLGATRVMRGGVARRGDGYVFRYLFYAPRGEAARCGDMAKRNAKT